MPKSKTICSAPFNQVCVTATGRYALCCNAVANYSFPCEERHINQMKNVNDWFEGKYMKNIRKAMIKGKKLKECVTCYEKEKTGKPSPRQWFNKEHPPLKMNNQFHISIGSTLNLATTVILNAKCVFLTRQANL